MTPNGGKPKYLLPLAIIALGLILRLWGLSSSDLQGDAAINSFRALGWYDYLLSDIGQSSPLSWFGYFPWWSYLSFHDHPPLVFALQHVFFRFFGSASVVALTPHLLAYLGTAYLLYKGLRRLRNQRAALLTLLVFSISSYSIWATRTGYLEGVAMFFVTLAFIALCDFFEKRRPVHLYTWAAAVGFGLLSKYTTIFAPAAGVVSLVLWNRSVFRSKHWWASAALILAMLTPVIIYNVMMFSTRGHFDASLSAMAGMHPEDFSAITGRSSTLSLSNILSVWSVLAAGISVPLFVLALASLFFLLKKLVTRSADTVTRVLLITLATGIVLFSFAGASERFLTILTPFIAITVACALDSVFLNLQSAQRRKLLAYGFGLIMAFELFYAVNTNILPIPAGSSPWLFSSQRFYNRGFQQLDEFLRSDVLPELPAGTDRTKYGQPDFQSAPTVIVDDRADWFSLMWYFRRYLYYSIPVITVTDLYKISAQSDTNALEYLYKRGARQFWFVHILPAGVRRNAEESYTSRVELFDKQLKDAGVKPQNFTDYKGTPVFEVYRFEYQ